MASGYPVAFGLVAFGLVAFDLVASDRPCAAANAEGLEDVRIDDEVVGTDEEAGPDETDALATSAAAAFDSMVAAVADVADAADS